MTNRIFRDKGREEALDDTDAIAAAREAGRREMREECAEAAAAWSRSRGGSDQVTQKLADAIRSIPVRKP